MGLSHPLLFIASQAGFPEEIGDLWVKFENEGEGEKEGVAGWGFRDLDHHFVLR